LIVRHSRRRWTRRRRERFTATAAARLDRAARNIEPEQVLGEACNQRRLPHDPFASRQIPGWVPRAASRYRMSRADASWKDKRPTA